MKAPGDCAGSVFGRELMEEEAHARNRVVRTYHLGLSLKILATCVHSRRRQDADQTSQHADDHEESETEEHNAVAPVQLPHRPHDVRLGPSAGDRRQQRPLRDRDVAIVADQAAEVQAATFNNGSLTVRDGALHEEHKEHVDGEHEQQQGQCINTPDAMIETTMYRPRGKSGRRKRRVNMTNVT